LPFLGPDLERPKSYQNFLAMGKARLKKVGKISDLHPPEFSFIISVLADPR